MTEQPASVPAQLRWPQDHPVLRTPLPANQAAVTYSPSPDGTGADAILLTFGYISGPLVAGTPDEQQMQILELTGSPGSPLKLMIEPQARILLSPEMARRTRDILNDVLQGLGAGEGPGADA